MTMDQAIDIIREVFQLFLLLSAPVLVAGLVVGLLIGVLQAMTQVQEQTLSMVPKILIMTVVAALSMPWVATQVLAFAARMFGGLE